MSGDEVLERTLKLGVSFVFPGNINGLAHHGLTKRELFAAMALVGILAKYGADQPDISVDEAVSHADALLAELGKGDK